MLAQFRIFSPESVEEACAFLAEYGFDAAVYAGGTELLLAMKEGLLAPDYLVDIKPLGLGGIELGSATGELRLGATITHMELERWCRERERWTTLAELERQVANVRVRNQGTIGGNLCFGEPHADPGILLAAWEASVDLVGPLGRRCLAVEDFLVDEFVTALEDDEIMTAIVIPAMPPRSASDYRRFGFLERPTLGVAALLAVEPDGETICEARVAVGAVGPRPERLEVAERELVGATIGGSLWTRGLASAAEHAANACAVSGDVHGSEEYKRHLVDVHVRRALGACRERLTGGGRRNGDFS